MNNTNQLEAIITLWQQGDKTAEAELFNCAYIQLRAIAQKERARLAAKYGDNNKVLADCINNTTALIHDAYLKISASNFSAAGIARERDFFLLVSKVMRQILIDHARTMQAQKRQHVRPQAGKEHTQTELLLSMDKCLDTFSEHYPRQSQALKLKYLLGMKNNEISTLLQCSNSLIEKDLKFSRSWLQARIGGA